MDPSCEYYLDSFSDFTTPPKVRLHRSDGTILDIVEANADLIDALNEYRLSQPDFFSFETGSNVTLNAFMMKPPDFDPSKKYPVRVYVYGGPGSQTVVNAWDTNARRRQLWHEMMTQRGYIIFSVDNRGTGARGRDWMHVVYWELGTFEVQDQLASVEYLRTLPYVDSARIGIWGWSYGGYLASLCLLKGPDYFTIGLAVAPPTDWRNHDTIYTERYMGKPQDNPEGYVISSTLTYVNNLTGRFLLVHGSSDDNVHLSNTMQLAYALQNARKPFDLMIYPRKAHHIEGEDTRIHLFTLMTQYITENL